MNYMNNEKYFFPPAWTALGLDAPFCKDTETIFLEIDAFGIQIYRRSTAKSSKIFKKHRLVTMFIATKSNVLKVLMVGTSFSWKYLHNCTHSLGLINYQQVEFIWF